MIKEKTLKERSLLFAKLAELAYSNDATKQAKKLGFTTIEFYNKDGAQAWRFQNKTDLVIACWGTEPTAFNDIKADLFDKQIAYIALDNHKFGDYQPYLYKTTDGGKKWTSISDGIPDGTLVWRIVQDHINPNLLFLGTEYGVYVSLNKGEKWHKFSSGVPTIPVRDLAIQKRENDLVLELQNIVVKLLF